jgi:hypothetical protein
MCRNSLSIACLLFCVSTALSQDDLSVAPGKVQWREDFAAACAASRDSGKPVLLFQLLGKLDQEYT